MPRKKSKRGRSRRPQSGKQNPPVNARTESVAVAAASPLVPQQPIIQASQGSASQTEVEQIEQTVTRHVRADTFFTFVIAVAAVVQGVVCYLQWEAMKAQNIDTFRQAELALQATQQTDKTLELMRLEQRPWLSIITPTHEPLVAGQPLRCVITVKNTGSTPAEIIRNKIVALTELPETPIDVVIGKFEGVGMAPNAMQSTIIVPPEETVAMQPQLALPITKELMDAVADGTLQLYLFCRFNYLDTIGHMHESSGCFVVKPDELRFYSSGAYGRMD